MKGGVAERRPTHGRIDAVRLQWHLLFGIVAWCSFVQSAHATLKTVGQPSAAYTSSTTLLPIAIADGDTTTSLADAALTVTFDHTMEAATVPDGGFNNWGSPPNTESNTPRVLIPRANSLTLTLTPSGITVRTLGIEIETNGFNTFTINADFYNGAKLLGSITRRLTAPGAPIGPAADGAQLFAAVTDEQLTSVVITVEDNAGMALGQVRYSQAGLGATAPAMSAGVLSVCALLLLAGGMWSRFRRSALSS